MQGDRESSVANGQTLRATAPFPVTLFVVNRGDVEATLLSTQRP